MAATEASASSARAGGAGPGSDGGGEGGGEEEEEKSAGESDDDHTSKLIHWWCHRQLLRYLSKLHELPDADSFLEPMPWESMGFTDYLEVVEIPSDLRTVEESLLGGKYDDIDGLVDPDLFWDDINRIWENCEIYAKHNSSMDAEILQNAGEMRVYGEDMESEFLEELERFELSLAGSGARVANITAVADVAAAKLDDAMTSIGQWWWGDEGADAGSLLADPADLPPPAPPTPPPRAPSLFVGKRAFVDAYVGRGSMEVTMLLSAPPTPADRSNWLADLLESLAAAAGLGANDIKVDTKWLAKELASPRFYTTVGHGEDLPRLVFSFFLRLKGAQPVEALQKAFGAETAARRVERDCANTVQVVCGPLLITNISRVPTSHHFLDVIWHQTHVDVSSDLTEMEDDLLHRLEESIVESKRADERELAAMAKAQEFPEASQTRSLLDLRLGLEARMKRFASRSYVPSCLSSNSSRSSYYISPSTPSVRSSAHSRRPSTEEGRRSRSSRHPSAAYSSNPQSPKESPRAASYRERAPGDELEIQYGVDKLITWAQDG